MRIHLLTTDVSCFSLVDQLIVDEVTALVIPSNRVGSSKIKVLREEAERRKLPLFIHQRGQQMDASLPKVDAAISWLYSQIIVGNDLIRYPAGIFNMHGGVIPDYRGASVLQWAIINGEDELGISWHEIVEEVDAGPIWAESRIPVPHYATALDVRSEMIQEGIRLFPEAWEAFNRRGAGARYPNLSTGKIWPQRKPADGIINRGWTERQVRDMVRALCPPWPPATIDVDGLLHAIDHLGNEASPQTVPYDTADGSRLFLSLSLHPGSHDRQDGSW
jgi:methionyl-tRNA formyltransferase